MFDDGETSGLRPQPKYVSIYTTPADLLAVAMSSMVLNNSLAVEYSYVDEFCSKFFSDQLADDNAIHRQRSKLIVSFVFSVI
jgi:hypothetical protein